MRVGLYQIYMTDFNQKQWKEIEASAISRNVAEKHFVSLTGKRALDEIFYSLPNEKRRNDGRACDYLLKKYDPIFKHGGLAIYGYHPITEEQTECISFKPTQPLEPGRKYEQPPYSENQAFYPYGGDGYWQKVIDDDRPIILTEGCKKALSAISHGFPCVALTGVWNGVKAIKNENEETQEYKLIPSLQHLAGRKIYIAFDKDQQASTIKKVTQARSELIKALIKIGCECYVMRWDIEYKGLDDLIVGCGAEAVQKSIDTAKLDTGENPELKKKLVKNTMGEDLAKESKGRILFDEMSRLWTVYKGGRWKAKGKDSMESVIYHRVIQNMPEINSVNLIPDIMKFMKYKLTVEEWKEASTLEFFPFKNGVWSFKERKLLPHSPDYFWKWQLDRDYSPTIAGWSSIDKFLDTVSSGDGSIKNLLIAACGSVLQGTPEIQKALYLFGGGANGKGSFLKLLEMLVGDDNAHSTTLENICENRFEMANLCDKRLVICPDEDRRVRGLSAFKSLTGGDSLRAEEKGKKAYKFTFKGMVAIASNNPTFFGDDSYGLSRRLIPIPFRHQVPESQRRNLIPEFTADLPAFTTYLLNLDRDWIVNTLRQSKDIQAIKDLEWELTLRIDSVAAFFEERLIYDPASQILAADIYPQYRQFCNDGGFVTKHQNNFCPSLVNLLVDKLGKSVESRKTKRGKVIHGLRLRTVLDPIGDEVTTVTAKSEETENKLSPDHGDEVTTVTAKSEETENKLSPDHGDEVTAVTTNLEKNIISEFSPQPPTVDRTVPEYIEVNPYFKYRMTGDRVDWLELTFHSERTANKWDRCLSIVFSAQTRKPHEINRNGKKKWILVVKGVTLAQVKQLEAMDLDKAPELIHR